MPDSRSEWHHWYNTSRWKQRRKQQLAHHPLCVYCLQLGHVTAADTVDHVEPHRGDELLFFEGPLQSLCKTCHDSAKQRQETTGQLPGCNVDGWPLDPSSPWNR